MRTENIGKESMKKKNKKELPEDTGEVQEVTVRRVHHDRWDEFARCYAVHFNATKAAEEAGYSKKTARQQGAHLLSKVYIQEKVKKLLEANEERSEKSSDEIIQELEKVAFSNILDVIDIKDGKVSLKKDIPKDALNGVASLRQGKTSRGRSFHISMKDKIRALELLGRRFGLFPTNAKPKEEGISWTEVYKAAERSGLLDY